MKHPVLNNYAYQRGAIGLVGILVLMTSVLFTALVVDSGRLWMQKKRLQSVADLAAIQASRYLGCNPNLSNIVQMAQLAASNNGYDGQLSQSPNKVMLGRLDTVQGIRQFTADGSHQAVYVKATKVVPKSLVAGGLFGGTLTLHAEAVSVADPVLAAFSVATSTATLNNEQSALLNGLLGGMLGGALNLNVLTYRGIAETKVRLQDLLTVSGKVGTYSELLATNMKVGDIIELVADAAGQNSAADVQVISGIQKIAAVTVNNAQLTLGDILSITTPDKNAAAAVGLNALSLITTAAMIANGKNAINLPLGVNVPSISSINAQVYVVEPPQLVIGPAAGNGQICTIARTAQVKARANVLVTIPLLATIDLALVAEVSQGTAGLRTIQQNDSSTQVDIEAKPGLAALYLTNNAGTGPANVSTSVKLLFTTIKVSLANISLDLPIQPATPQTLQFTVNHPVKNNLPQTKSVASPLASSLQSSLSNPNSLDVTVLSTINLGLLNTVISTIISPLLSEIARVLLDPLLNMLGIQIDGMDVTLDDVQYRQPKPLAI